METETPGHWLRQGQAQETENTPASLAAAVQSYEQAIALLQGRQPASHDLGIALMNLGNARQKQMDADAPESAIHAYDRAIALLTSASTPDDLAACNSIGAAWMNRGHALQRRRTPETLTAALHSYDRAIAQLETLPSGTNRFFTINLAAALLNRAQALLTFAPPLANAAHNAANRALKLTIDIALTDPIAAEVTLKIYHALCSALSFQLSAQPNPALIAETGDIIDESLALVRHWERQGVQNIRPFEVIFYRFGARFYLAHQPQFLGEFLLETIAHTGAPGIEPDTGDLRSIAVTGLAQARADIYNRSLLDPHNEHLRKLREEMEAANRQLDQAPQSRGTVGNRNTT